MKKNEFTITGGKEIARVLEKFPQIYVKKSMRSAFRAGAKPVLKEAQRRAPKDTHELENSIVIRVPTRRVSTSKEDVILIAIKKPASRRAHLSEFGTGPRYQESTGRYTGSSPAKPFLRPALDLKGTTAIGIILDRSWSNIKKIVRQLNKGEKVSLRRK